MIEDSAYFESEAFQKLLKQYEDSAKSGHSAYMDADDLADIADYYQYNGKLQEATDAINLALSYNPDAVGPLLYKAREALATYDFEAAREYAERIKAFDALEALYFEGEILICEGKYKEADELYREHLKTLMPDEQMDYVFDIANIFSEYCLFDTAFKWLMRSQGDDSEEFKELMARTLFGLGKYKDSERIFNELVDNNPYSKRYWNALASAQFMSEDYGAAITSSEYAIAIDPNDVEGILSKANSLFNMENYETALDYFRKYSEKMDFDEFGHLHQATCLINLGRYEEAIQALERAEERADKDSLYLPEIYQELAFAYNERHLVETALYYIDKTADLDCDHINMEIIRGHILLANGRVKEAETVFKEALMQSDEASRTLLRIIVSLYDNHYTQAAYRLLKKFIGNADTDWNEGYAYMALCCWDLKHYDEFLTYLQEAVARNPKEARLVLGNLFPKEIQPKDYYEYIRNKISEKES